MITIDARTDIDVRNVEPQAVRLALCPLHQWTTLAGECDHVITQPCYRYAVIGTAYGYMRNIHGDVKLWHTASSAYRAARAYRRDN